MQVIQTNITTFERNSNWLTISAMETISDYDCNGKLELRKSYLYIVGAKNDYRKLACIVQ